MSPATMSSPAGTTPAGAAPESVRSPLDRAAFLRGIPLKTVDVDVPGLGLVTLSELTGADRATFEDRMTQHEGADGKSKVVMTGLRELLIVLSAVKPDGTKLLTMSDMPAVGRLPATALQQLFEAASAVSGLGNKALEAEVDRLKNDTASAG